MLTFHRANKNELSLEVLRSRNGPNGYIKPRKYSKAHGGFNIYLNIIFAYLIFFFPIAWDVL
jgi:hypothetical protein